MVAVGVDAVRARLVGDRTNEFVISRRGHLCAVVKAGSLGYKFGQYTPRADDLEDRVRGPRPAIRRETLKAVDVGTIAEVLSRMTAVLRILDGR